MAVFSSAKGWIDRVLCDDGNDDDDTNQCNLDSLACILCYED